jgi:hypothetical protein
VPCIVRDGKFSIYVYADDHNPPHCHVFWGGDKEAVVDLNPVAQSEGDRLPRAGLELVRDHLAELLDAWNRLNP